MAKRLLPATGRRLAALALLAPLCACATPSAEPRTATLHDGWRVVERTGEARYSPPGIALWMSATTGQALADGSEVATGRGGRLIVNAPGRHLSVGPDSRFVLPARDWDHRLDQRAGWLRYRIAEADAQPFRIHTRSLELELRAGVVDVHVDHLATEVIVKQGQVRVATPDGLRHSQMMAGQSAHAGGSDSMALAVRLAPGAALQPVHPVIIPALRPRSNADDDLATTAPAPEPGPGRGEAGRNEQDRLPRAAVQDPGRARAGLALGPVPADPAPEHSPGRAGPAAASFRPALAPAGARGENSGKVAAPAVVAATAKRHVPRAGAADRLVAAAERNSSQTDPAAIRRSKFERLTAGMIEGVEPPRPAPIRR